MPRPHPTGEQLELAHGDQRAVVVEVGGGLRRYAVGDWDVVDGFAAEERVDGSRGQLLMPWPNRVRDGRWTWDGTPQQLALSEPARRNAIHGLVRWAAWRAVVHEADRVVMAHRLHPQQGWPFTLDLEVAYALGEAGLAVELRATNPGTEPVPFGAGQHPYLRVGARPLDETLAQWPAATRLLLDERQIAVGEEPVAGTAYDFCAPRPLGGLALDDCFTALARDDDGRARVHLSDRGGSRRVTLWMDEAYDYLMVYSGDTLAPAAARRRSLAVEPMTCAPDALNSGAGLRVLGPGETFAGAWGIAAEPR